MFCVLAFGACYVYSPQGVGQASARSRRVRAFLKSGDQAFLLKYARIVKGQVSNGCLLSRLFDENPILVPIPGAIPRGPESPWVAERLCLALRRQGLGRSVWTGLRRVSAVRKSGTASPDERPSTWTHYNSFLVDSPPADANRILLVDDIVTKGRTLLAAATRNQETCPGARVEAFAFVRTMGLVSDVKRLVDPCLGEIRWRRGDAHRAP